MNTNDASTSLETNGKRRTRLIQMAALFAVVALLYGVYYFSYGRFHIETDNAYVNGNLVQIVPQSAGTVIAINADDTDFVQAGQVLVQLDPADAKVALDQAEADLARTVRDVRAAFATTDSLRAQLAGRQAELARARADYKRRYEMRASGAVSREDLAHSESAVRGAEANEAAAREQLSANLAQTENTTVETHPSVQRASASVREAYLGYVRAKLPAPVSGYVAKRSVQLGARVQAGAPLMAIVPLDALWIDANFKEVQLSQLRIGQPVELSTDLYGSSMKYHGRVEGLAAGTGSAFSLLPAQNATGNWIKIVQRLPVRISLDPAELKEHPLRVGLSVRADINTHDTSGAQLALAKRAAPAYETAVYDNLAHEADTRVAAIIAANGATVLPLADRGIAHASP